MKTIEIKMNPFLDRTTKEAKMACESSLDDFVGVSVPATFVVPSEQFYNSGLIKFYPIRMESLNKMLLKKEIKDNITIFLVYTDRETDTLRLIPVTLHYPYSYERIFSTVYVTDINW